MFTAVQARGRGVGITYTDAKLTEVYNNLAEPFTDMILLRVRDGKTSNLLRNREHYVAKLQIEPLVVWFIEGTLVCLRALLRRNRTHAAAVRNTWLCMCIVRACGCARVSVCICMYLCACSGCTLETPRDPCTLSGGRQLHMH